MIWLTAIGLIVLVCFALVLLVGAPYVPTLTPQVEAALELLNLKPDEHLVELGCGDGKVLVAAAQIGLTATGYELNPILALIAWLRTRRYKGRVKVVWGDFWGKQWPPAAGVFVFLHPRFMKKLNTKVIQQYPDGVKVVSFAFKIPDRPMVAKKAGVFLYDYQPN